MRLIDDVSGKRFKIHATKNAFRDDDGDDKNAKSIHFYR
jgi:hypothetical protein